MTIRVSMDEMHDACPQAHWGRGGINYGSHVQGNEMTSGIFA
jgi:hypothetical protein